MGFINLKPYLDLGKLDQAHIVVSYFMMKYHSFYFGITE